MEKKVPITGKINLSKSAAQNHLNLRQKTPNDSDIEHSIELKTDWGDIFI